MDKPVLQTLRMLVEMEGHCTKEDLLEWSDQSGAYVLQTLHRNQDLIKTRYNDSSVFVGDWCEHRYRRRREADIKSWWPFPEKCLHDHFETSMRVSLMNAILFDQPDDKYAEDDFLNPFHPEFKVPSHDPLRLAYNDFPRFFNEISKSGWCITIKTAETLSELEKRGYIKKAKRERQIDEEVEEGKHNELWDE